jgi:hypothetical protein
MVCLFPVSAQHAMTGVIKKRAKQDTLFLNVGGERLEEPQPAWIVNISV